MSNEYEEFMKSSQQNKKEIKEIVQTVSDRVSWRRAWSLFYKLIIMGALLMLLVWIFFIAVISNTLSPSQPDTSYKECLKENRDHPFTEELCKSYK
jgi:hypothetical protein